MAINYRLTKITNNTNPKVGWYYGRAVNMGDTNTDTVASMIEANCTVKRADIVAVLSELAFVMKHELQNGKRVILNDLGSFKATLSTSASEKATQFGLKNVRGVRVQFTPEKVWDRAKKRYDTAVTKGVVVQELPNYDMQDVKDAEKNAATQPATPATPGSGSN